MVILGYKNLIRKVLLEYHGNQTDIDEIETIITNDIVDTTTEHLSVIVNQGRSVIISEIEVDDIQRQNNTQIQKIKTEVSITITDQTQATGQFNPKTITLIDNDMYSIELSVVVNLNPQDIDNLKKEIGKVISHELHHAFREIKLIGKQSRSKIYNLAQNLSKLGFKDLYNDYPELKDFMVMFYLALPQEITARVQETTSILKNIESTNYNDVTNQLLRYQPLIDAKKMIKYDMNEIKNVDNDKLNNFITEFNKNIKYYGDKENIDIKTKNTVDSFVYYWGSKISRGGMELFRKISTLASDKCWNDKSPENRIKHDLLAQLMGDDYD